MASPFPDRAPPRTRPTIGVRLATGLLIGLISGGLIALLLLGASTLARGPDGFFGALALVPFIFAVSILATQWTAARGWWRDARAARRS